MTPLEQQAHPGPPGLEVASGLTTPESAGLLAASGGLGALETPAAGLLRYLPRLVSAGFTAQMVKGLYDAYPAYKNAVDRGDTSEAKRIQTEMGAQGVLAFLSGTHAVTGETPVQAARQGIGELAERTGAPANSLLREISQPSPAPGTAANVPVFAGGRLSEDLAREQVANAAGASGMGQLAQAEQAIPPQEIVAPAPSQPPITPLPAVPPEPNALAIQAALPSHEDLSDAIVKDGGDPNFADNRANQLLAAARGELGYTGIERRAASGSLTHTWVRSVAEWQLRRWWVQTRCLQRLRPRPRRLNAARRKLFPTGPLYGRAPLEQRETYSTWKTPSSTAGLSRKTKFQNFVGPSWVPGK